MDETSEPTLKCVTCELVLPSSCFYRHSNRKSGYQTECKTCLIARARANKLRRVFGLTEDDYDRLLTKQHGACAICGRHCPTGNRLAVDHNHTTGEVRGLLCMECNTGLGKFGDDAATLRAAIAYLETPPNHAQ